MGGWMRLAIKMVSVVVFLIWMSVPGQAMQDPILERLRCGVIDRPPARFELPAFKQKITILMIGSSSTSGVGAGDISKAYPARTAFHLNADAALPMVRVIAKGVGGERAKGAVRRLPDAIRETAPDLVVWQVGTNDALGNIPLDELRNTVQEGLAIVRAQNLPVILIDPQFFPRILDNETYTKTIQLLAEISTENSLAIVKRYARMKQALAMEDVFMSALMAKDRLHMSEIGHECLALDLAATLKIPLREGIR